MIVAQMPRSIKKAAEKRVEAKVRTLYAWQGGVRDVWASPLLLPWPHLTL